MRRLLPDHYLDLESFVPANAIADRLQRNVDTINTSEPIAMALTAGRDSRMVLAASWRRAMQARYCTFASPNADLDCRAAGALARRAGITSQRLPWCRPDCCLSVQRGTAARGCSGARLLSALAGSSVGDCAAASGAPIAHVRCGEALDVSQWESKRRAEGPSSVVRIQLPERPGT